MVPDYSLEEAAKLYKEIIKPVDEPQKGIKRKLTIEEFVGIEPKDETQP